MIVIANVCSSDGRNYLVGSVCVVVVVASCSELGCFGSCLIVVVVVVVVMVVVSVFPCVSRRVGGCLNVVVVMVMSTTSIDMLAYEVKCYAKKFM